MTIEESRIFRGSWRKQMVLIAVCFAIAAMCYFQSKKFPPMIVIGGFIAVTGAVGLWGMMRGWAVLALDSRGFEFRLIDLPKRYSWEEASDFLSEGYGVSYMRNGTEPRMILNVFDASSDVICQGANCISREVRRAIKS
jgi:hypothetical protein